MIFIIYAIRKLAVLIIIYKIANFLKNFQLIVITALQFVDMKILIYKYL